MNDKDELWQAVLSEIELQISKPKFSNLDLKIVAL